MFSLDNAEFVVEMSLPHSLHRNHMTRRSPSSDPYGSPVAEWRDTPQTLYRTSPATEVGDNDVFSDLEAEGIEGEEVASRNERVPRGSLFEPTPQHAPGETAIMACDPPSETPFQTFARRLHADIRSTSSLFPGIPLEPLPRPVAPLHQASPPDRMRTNTVSLGLPGIADVTANTPYSQPLCIPRKRSMHLKHPSDPINPYQRQKPGESTPAHRYPAAVIDRTFLRRFRTSSPPQRTVSMKELLVPHAEFRFGYDPEVLASELDSPTVPEFDSAEDGSRGEVTEDLREDANVVQRTPDVLPTELSLDDGDSWDLPDNADDVTWTPETASEGPHQRLAKRRRTDAGVLSDAISAPEPMSNPRPPQQAVTRTRRPHHDVTKARKRHLQPNLVRTNGCLYGCPLLFSTAYEARRHQEDTHGREEAYSFIKAASDSLQQPIFAKDYRFLLQIAAHALGDKLEPRVRASLEEAVERDGAVLERSLIETIARFARDWTKRYECPRCGASFSRLDSKKRHYEKQCR
ncbi:hypothetical protein FS837_002246 [Tulasnella sp. UAMH 9824]|nr:hypothetical protein FS837_002246 [Tulasnella sp. UAMH 9824]